MFNLTRQEQLIALVLIGGILAGGLVYWLRGNPEPPLPRPLEREIKLPESDTDKNYGIEPRYGLTRDGNLIDVNTADSAELETVPGIGPKTAAGIIEYREAYGDFKDLDELVNVPGIGKKKLELFKGYLTVKKTDQ